MKKRVPLTVCIVVARAAANRRVAVAGQEKMRRDP